MRKIFAIILLGFTNAAWAIPVQWELEFQFDDGGSGSGSFYFDADTIDYSAISIVTTAGSYFSGETYNYLMPVVSSGDMALYVLAQNGGDLEGTPGMAINFGSSLTNVGAVIQITGFIESFCVDAMCSDSTEVYRSITSGTVSSVPIPAAVWLFGSALAGLGWLRRKQAV